MPLGAHSRTERLQINVAPFTSEVEIKEKVRKQIEGGGMEWGQAGNRLVVTIHQQAIRRARPSIS